MKSYIIIQSGFIPGGIKAADDYYNES